MCHRVPGNDWILILGHTYTFRMKIDHRVKRVGQCMCHPMCISTTGQSPDYRVGCIPQQSSWYTEDAGCAITTPIPVKFGTEHGKS